MPSKSTGKAIGVGNHALRTLGPAAATTATVGYFNDDWRSAFGAGLTTALTQLGGNLSRRLAGRVNPHSRAWEGVAHQRGQPTASALDTGLATARANLAAARGGPAAPDNRSPFYQGIDPVMQNRYGGKNGTISRAGYSRANTEFAALRNAIDPNTGAYDPSRVDPKIRPLVDRLHNDLQNAGVDLGAVKSFQGAFDFVGNPAPHAIPPDQARIDRFTQQIADLEATQGRRAGNKERSLERMRKYNPLVAGTVGTATGLVDPETTREVYEQRGGRKIENKIKDIAGVLAPETPSTDWAGIAKTIGVGGAVGVLGLLVYKLMQDDDEEEKPKSSSGRPSGTGRPRGRPRKAA